MWQRRLKKTFSAEMLSIEWDARDRIANSGFVCDFLAGMVRCCFDVMMECENEGVIGRFCCSKIQFVFSLSRSNCKIKILLL